MKRVSKFKIITLCALLWSLQIGISESPQGKAGCLSCHQGISPFTEGKMMDEIKALGAKHGDGEGCVVCHGGNPATILKAEAHKGGPSKLRAAGGPQRFYPNPGNARIAEYTCGQCHDGYAERLEKSLIGTETEGIHRRLCPDALAKFPGSAAQRTRCFGENVLKDSDGLIPAVGTEAYKNFMAALTNDPNQFAELLHPLPVLTVDTVIADWDKRCASCHNARPVAQVLEDEHGVGCASCHVPYREGGFYLGNDPTIAKDEPGKLLFHRLQGNSSSGVVDPHQNGNSDITTVAAVGAAISLDNCFSCHHDLRKQELNPIGTALTHYGNFHEDGAEGTLFCQDCHTTIDMHGDGNIPLNSYAQVEIQCEDCHGTINKTPWELPLGYGGKIDRVRSDQPRGLTMTPPDVIGRKYPAKDGYLLTSRGNPFGNVVKDGDEVILHSISGKSINVPVLKLIHDNETWKSPRSRATKMEAPAHIEMDCLSCHGDRVQLCYGCHGDENKAKGWDDSF